MEGKIIYKDLSYKIIGILFEVFNEFGYGYKEKFYEKAIEQSLYCSGLEFKRQKRTHIYFRNQLLSRLYLDFLIEDKIVLELKVGRRFARPNFNQIKQYLSSTGKKLGILAIFTYNGVRYYRILNLYNQPKKLDYSNSKIRKIFFNSTNS